MTEGESGDEPTKEEEEMAEQEFPEEKFREKEMAQKLEELAKTEEFVVGGETSIDDEVIASIAGVAAKEVEGVASLGTPSIRRTLAERLTGAEARARGVDVEAGKREAIIDLALNVIYGFSIPTIRYFLGWERLATAELYVQSTKRRALEETRVKMP